MYILKKKRGKEMKKVLISLLSIIFIISMITTVNAATGTITAGASANTIIKGKTFKELLWDYLKMKVK